jgi:hypothetical protein
MILVLRIAAAPHGFARTELAGRFCVSFLTLGRYWRFRRMKAMRIVYAVALAAGVVLLPAAASAQERVGDAALGALAGAVVGGPVGAVAGGAIGYTAGPRIAHGMGIRHRHVHHVRHARTQDQAAR